MKDLNCFAVILFLVLAVSCKPRTFNSSMTQGSSTDTFSSQFEITRFATCKNSIGKETGGLNFVWRVKSSSGQPVSPYILGFAGSTETVDGQKIEFRSVTTIDEPRYRIPRISGQNSFPVPSYFAASLQFPESELSSGWGYFTINGKKASVTDALGGTLILPKYLSSGDFSQRYFIVTTEGATLEFNCQPFSDAIRERMRTYLVKDGSHGFSGARGDVVSSTSSTENRSAGSKSSSLIDLRPSGRPANYDAQFRHEAIYECGENERIEVIWRQAMADGKKLPLKAQYILGLAAALKDPTRGELRFSSVSIDGAPAFAAGTEPSPVSFMRPMFYFDESEVKNKMSYHSAIPGLSGRSMAVGGTLWVPYDGSGNSVSVAVALGSVVRGAAFQVISDCTPKHDKIRNWLISCVGQESVVSNTQCLH